MKELFFVYWPNLIATTIIGCLLPFLGAHLVARGESVKVLSLSQSAGLGVTVGMLILRVFFPDHDETFYLLPVTFGFVFSTFCFLGINLFEREGGQNIGLYFATFLGSWAATQALIGYFPAIEAMQANIYFGDIVTLSKERSLFFSAGAFAISACLILQASNLKNRTFELAVLHLPWKWGADFWFSLICLLAITISIQYLGLLFTLSALFLPTVMLSFSRLAGVNLHIFLAVSIGGAASFLGFICSLINSRLLTTPTISIFLIFLPMLLIVGPLKLFRCK